MTLNTENWMNRHGMFEHEDSNGNLLACVYLTKEGWVAEIIAEAWGYEGFEDNFSAMAWADSYLTRKKQDQELEAKRKAFENFLNRNDKRFNIDYQKKRKTKFHTLSSFSSFQMYCI